MRRAPDDGGPPRSLSCRSYAASLGCRTHEAPEWPLCSTCARRNTTSHGEMTMTNWDGIFKVLVSSDSRGPEFHGVAKRLFRQGLHGEFLTYVRTICPTWEHSPSAVLLVGHSHYYRAEFDRGQVCVD